MQVFLSRCFIVFSNAWKLFSLSGRLNLELLLRLYLPSCSIFWNRTSRLAWNNWFGIWSAYFLANAFICWWNDNFRSIVIPKIFTSLLLIIFYLKSDWPSRFIWISFLVRNILLIYFLNKLLKNNFYRHCRY